ncbi:MFS general substrate transporter [Cutaneotrichosporon oleaginosum]|uniref:MFS general substrate transporter n=2 Tax=Cutaneotrichosporon oleaginosum TaxID=879819 RepID=A0A0J0XH41_9TREE|nr:MFS general substrate transporter [Cutaneotrichosporon oleaginosum]KLT40406.1 MFS general substrate transporter [Cutaneotrichosporon oleaginosum]
MEQAGRNPDLPPNHPINALSNAHKMAILATLSFSGCLMNFIIAIVLVAFPPMGAAFDVSPSRIPSTIGYQLLGMAVGPVFWNPLSRTLGRRPVYLIGSVLSLPCCVWLALSNSFPVFAVGRTVMGLIGSFSQTVPPATVADIFRPEIRGHKMSTYGVAVVISPCVAPVFSGLIVDKHSWRNLFWFCLALCGLQLILYFFIVPETLWVEAESKVEEIELDKGVYAQTEVATPYGAGRTGVAWYPWARPREYLGLLWSPIAMLRFAAITLPSFYYGSLFAWSVGLTVVMPQTFENPPYSFGTVPLGCAFLAFGVGGVLGKWSGGLAGDKAVAYVERRRGSRQPEHRLWALLPVLPLMLVALLLVGLSIDHAWHWAVLLVFGGLYFFTLSAATGVFQTYVLESYLEKSMDTQAVFQFWKMMWGFAVSFFAMQWGQASGFTNAYAVQGALACGVGLVLTVMLLWKGEAIRMAQRMPVFE